MRYEQRVQVDADPQTVWAFFWDIPRVASCLPGCTEARALADPHRYAAVVAQRVGPFQVRFNVEITVTEAEEPRRITAVAQGKDSGVASQVKAALEVLLEPTEGGATVIRLLSDVTVLGKLGGLGHGIIARKGEEILEQFGRAIQARLGSEVMPA